MRAGRWRDHRQVINGILWKLRTGAPWRDLPERYGPWKTCHERLRRWSADGTWDRILAAAQVYDDGQPVDWIISVDSSVVRAHQHVYAVSYDGDRDRIVLQVLPEDLTDAVANLARGGWQ